MGVGRGDSVAGLMSCVAVNDGVVDGDKNALLMNGVVYFNGNDVMVDDDGVDEYRRNNVW